jgi:hypothetical protein
MGLTAGSRSSRSWRGQRASRVRKDRGGHVAAAVATEPTQVLLLRRADLLDPCRRRPGVALSILDLLLIVAGAAMLSVLVF